MGLYFHHPACLEHDPRAYMPEHPDTPERLEAIERVLAEHGWSGWEHRAAPPAKEAQLELIHSPRHVQRIKELSLAGAARSTRTRSSASLIIVRRCTPLAARAR
jgi:acetoin utilization deacetylase AcuC-like enzyme